MRLPYLLGGARRGTLLFGLLLIAACATPIDSAAPQGSESLDGDAGTGSADAGATGIAGGANNTAGASASAGASTAGSSSAGASNGGANSAGAPSAGASNGGSNSGGAGKGGASSGGAPSAGASSGGANNGGAGKGGSSSGGAPSAGAGNTAGSGNTAGAPPTVPCNAANSKATLTHNTVYTGKANDCIRLSVNPNWAQVTVSFTPQPGTVYPVPFAYTSTCAAGGNMTLTANYADAIIKSGANPGCDYFVQFKGGTSTVKVIYYD